MACFVGTQFILIRLLGRSLSKTSGSAVHSAIGFEFIRRSVTEPSDEVPIFLPRVYIPRSFGFGSGKVVIAVGIFTAQNFSFNTTLN